MRNPYLWLRPAVDVVRDQSALALIDAQGSVLQINDSGKSVERLLSLLDGSHRETELMALPGSEHFIPILRERGWLVTLTAPLAELLRARGELSREISAFAQLFPEDLDRHFLTLGSKRVLIIGTGGIGVSVAFGLAAAGTEALTIADPDLVDRTNLNRQFLFALEDIGQPKVEVVKRELSRRFPSTGITSLQADFDCWPNATEVIGGSNLIIVCGESALLYDSPDLVSGTPLIMAGYRSSVGTVGPLIDPSLGSACWGCLMRGHARDAMRIVEECSVAREYNWNPSGFAMNSALGALCSRVCLEFLSEQPTRIDWLGVQLAISMSTLEISKHHVEPSSCIHSGTFAKYEHA